MGHKELKSVQVLHCNTFRDKMQRSSAKLLLSKGKLRAKFYVSFRQPVTCCP